jgi:hypothetical protein
MPQYIVLKTSAGGIPADGNVGSADIYIGTHVDVPTAAGAAATKWNLPASVPLWVVLTSSLAQYHTAVSVTAG